jgi:hypothetical protein
MYVVSSVGSLQTNAQHKPQWFSVTKYLLLLYHWIDNKQMYNTLCNRD